MKVLLLNGSPRLNGNTAAALAEMENVFTQEGIEVETVQVGAWPIRGCTACRYCCDGCPVGLDIPMLLSVYNDIRVSPVFTVAMGIEALPEEKRPSACISCGKCTRICPQNIDIPQAMKDFTQALSKIPSWEAICREREEAARRGKSK